MKRKNLLPVLLFAFSATLLLLIVSLQGNFFKASLIDNTITSSGFEMPSLVGSGDVLSTLILDETRTATYRTNIMAAADKDTGLGIYFPNIYTNNSTSGSFVLPLAYEAADVREFGTSLEIQLSYPSSLLAYSGQREVTNDFGRLTVDTETRQNSISFQFTPSASGTVLPASLPTLLAIPFSMKENAQPTQPAAFTIESVAMFEQDGSMSSIPFVKGNNSLVSFSAFSNSNSAGRPVMTRPVMTPESTNGKNNNSNAVQTVTPIPPTVIQPTVQINRKPYITADETRLSPGSVREGSGDTIFMYISVADPDGHGDVRSVLANLTEFGFGSSTPLIKIETTPTYAVYATSFVLQNTVRGSDLPKSIPFTVTDTANNIIMETMTMLVKPNQQPAAIPVRSTPVIPKTTTQTNQSTSTVSPAKQGAPAVTTNFAADFDGDGDVDSDDLKAFINIYEKETVR